MHKLNYWLIDRAHLFITLIFIVYVAGHTTANEIFAMHWSMNVLLLSPALTLYFMWLKHRWSKLTAFGVIFFTLFIGIALGIILESYIYASKSIFAFPLVVYWMAVSLGIAWAIHKFDQFYNAGDAYVLPPMHVFAALLALFSFMFMDYMTWLYEWQWCSLSVLCGCGFFVGPFMKNGSEESILNRGIIVYGVITFLMGLAACWRAVA